MNRGARVFCWVVGIHLAVVLTIGLAGLVKRLIKPRKKYEVVTTVQLSAPVAPLAPDVLEEPRPPAPQPDIPEPPPEPEPPPKPKPKLKTKDQVKVNKDKVVKKKITPEVKKPAPVTPKPKKLTEQDLDKILKAANPAGKPNPDLPPGPEVSADELQVLYALIREKMYTAWSQPSGISASAGYLAEISIRISRGGRISNHQLVKSSGHDLLDRTALAAARSVTSISGMPVSFPPHQDVTVEFTITD